MALHTPDVAIEPQNDAPGSILIEDVQPQVDCGRYPVKREVGDTLDVTADIFKDGHDKIAAMVHYRCREADEWLETEMRFVDNDRWGGAFHLSENTTYEYYIEAFPDTYATWVAEVQIKLEAGLDVGLELREGRELLEDVRSRAPADVVQRIETALRTVERTDDQAQNVADMVEPTLLEHIRPWRSRKGAVRTDQTYRVTVDRIAARFAAWYEMFPRSAGTIEDQSATFKDVEAQLPRIAGMGFDVLYFTPIHPIGTTNRKGKNNTLVARSEDPGVPYGIGSEGGGHDAIEPQLGTFEDFDRLVTAAAEHGLEIALDLAFQASPDHPWAEEHPEWFHVRPDGSIQYAENPPKKYQDIYPLNFQNENWRALWEELKRVVLVWVQHGVKTFRVDNPHTKPTIFWEWLIAEVQLDHPDVIFLSEAFTRPKVMKALAKAGFTQSYTYFTWRNFKRELIEYGEELTQSPAKEYMRGNFFTNTHDILPYFLQEGGRPAFQIRAVLASTMSSVYGIYSGFELCEATPVPGREEYLNSEKYEYKVWDWDRPGNIADYITSLNRIRHDHPALQEYDNLRFYQAGDDNVLCYGKHLEVDGEQDSIVIVLNLDPFQPHETEITLPIDQFGVQRNGQYRVRNLLTGEMLLWTGAIQTVKLDPHTQPAMILQVLPWIHKDFDEPCY